MNTPPSLHKSHTFTSLSSSRERSSSFSLSPPIAAGSSSSAAAAGSSSSAAAAVASLSHHLAEGPSPPPKANPWPLSHRLNHCRLQPQSLLDQGALTFTPLSLCHRLGIAPSSPQPSPHHPSPRPFFGRGYLLDHPWPRHCRPEPLLLWVALGRAKPLVPLNPPLNHHLTEKPSCSSLRSPLDHG